MSVCKFPTIDKTSPLLFKQMGTVNVRSNHSQLCAKHLIAANEPNNEPVAINADTTAEQVIFERHIEPVFSDRTMNFWLTAFGILGFAWGVTGAIYERATDSLLRAFGA